MRLTVVKEDLKKVLPFFTKLAADKSVVSGVPNYPDYITFYASQEEGLWVTGSNNDHTLSVRVEASIEEEGHAFCRVRLLSAFLNKVKAKGASLVLGGGDAESLYTPEDEMTGPFLTLKYGQSEYMVRTVEDTLKTHAQSSDMLWEDFKVSPSERTTRYAFQRSIEMTGEAFDSWRVAFAKMGSLCAKTEIEARQFLTGVLWRIKEHPKSKQWEMVVCATDGSKMGLGQLPVEGITTQTEVLGRDKAEPGSLLWNAVLAPKVIDYLKVLPKGTPVTATARRLKVHETDIVHIVADGFILTSYSLSDTYANYLKVFPKPDRSAVVSSDQIKEVLDRMSVFASRVNPANIRVTLGTNAITIRDARAVEGYNIEHIPAEVTMAKDAAPLERNFFGDRHEKDPGVLYDTKYYVPVLQSVLDKVAGPVRWSFSNNSCHVSHMEQVDEAGEVGRFTYLAMPTNPDRRG